VNSVSHHLREQAEFVRWADHALLVAARSVEDSLYHKQQLSKDHQPNNGTLHRAMVHAMAMQWLWVQRCRGESPTEVEDVSTVSTHMALEARWPLVHSALIDFVGRQTSHLLEVPMTFRDTRGSFCTMTTQQMIVLVVEQSAFHRGQISVLLRHAGGDVPSVSYRQFILRDGSGTDRRLVQK
jgi:uncharacterized damage-inducible protein DinB